MNELQEIFAQGDADLRATAGEPATLIRKNLGERLKLTAVISVMEIAVDLPTAAGGVVTCDRTAILNRAECTRAPRPGDRLETSGGTYEILRCTGWAYDTSWHVDIALRK